MTKKWNIFNDQSNANYDGVKQDILKSNLFDFNDAYLLVIGDITNHKTSCNWSGI